MRNARYIIVFFVVCLMLASVAQAGAVRVFKPMEEGVSDMELRRRALNEGFALAVLDDAKLMLPGTMDEVRTELFKEYMQTHAKPYIQGYKVLSSESMEGGLILSLDVRVNKPTLREGLKKMGLFATTQAPQSAAVTWPDTLNEESMAQLQGLITLTGLQLEQDVLPSFSIEPGPEKTFKGRLESDKREWVAINKDMAAVWFSLWGQYFTRSEVPRYGASVQKLSVSGWFSPDAALEFDRVLHAWDSAVQDVQLVELDMQPTGVGGTWEVRLLNGDRLDMLLKSYLPQRGLSYQLAEETEK